MDYASRLVLHRITKLYIVLVCLMNINSEVIRGWQKENLQRPRCNVRNMTHICLTDDCGQWEDKYFYPNTCDYQDISPEQARECIGNRTIAFIGDSQIRDTAMGIVYLLLGKYDVDNAPDVKLDRFNLIPKKGDPISTPSHWEQRDIDDMYGYVFPKNNTKHRRGFNWQIQFWSLHMVRYMPLVEEVLNNSLSYVFPNQLRTIDIGFWEMGLHELHWDKSPYGRSYFEQIVTPWLKFRSRVSTPSVLVSMNPECESLLKQNEAKISPLQVPMVEAANQYIRTKMMQERLPYWDSGESLRTNQRCTLSDDGVHVKMFVDLMRAKILFNHLCDEKMQWRGESVF